MRRATVLLVMVLTLAVPMTARAVDQQRPGDTTLVDETFNLAPGAALRECIDVPATAQLTVFVSSPPGRTGETVALNFSDDRQTVSPNVQLFTMDVPAEEIRSTHVAPAGSYCYYLAVTHALVSALPADAPEQPYKVVSLKIISTPPPG